MINKAGNARVASWGRALNVMLVVAMLVPLVAVAPAAPAAPHAQPILLQMAAERPTETVGVIVQKQVRDATVENLVARLGGVVTKDLHIINAFAAELPAKAIPELAQASGVRWVSLDSPMISRSRKDNYYLHNDPSPPAGDTTSHAVLPLDQTVPDIKTLYNYDVDRDTDAGLLIRRGGSGPFETDSTKVQRWRLDPFTSDVQIIGNTELKFYAVLKNFQKDRYAKVWAYLIDRNGDQAQVIASNFKEQSHWKNKWKRETIKFEGVNYTIPAGHQLEIAITVDAASADDMWFAYDTKKQAAHLKLNFLVSWPNYFLDTIAASDVWSHGYEGQGIRVAVVDSGVQTNNDDFYEDGQSRVVSQVNLNPDYYDAQDRYGHGTYIAGAIGSNGQRSSGLYQGVAPEVEFINVRVSDEWGSARESDVVAGLQWVYDNKDLYGIRVVNLSMNNTVAQSYHTSPLDAAAEILWFNGVVVVVSAGNNGDDNPGVIYPPANDPFLIVVGATDGLGTADPADDVLAEFSAYGTTSEGFFRPDLAAPGSYIVSSLASSSHFEREYADHVVKTEDAQGHLVKTNFVASGTSVSAGVVSGAAALLLSAMPDLNPDQVKYLLTSTATPLPGEPGAGAGIVNAANLVQTALSYGTAAAVPTANTGYEASQLLWTGSDPVQWNSVNWDSVNWDSVNWDSVNWGSVNWDSVNWDSVDLNY
ncbi:MAG: hypothetical protein D6791_11205 [Chloroflexi bacterium]|nr:MAG: hypothetical protein D6791_11205 [Chloroflexota bacterium]